MTVFSLVNIRVIQEQGNDAKADSETVHFMYLIKCMCPLFSWCLEVNTAHSVAACCENKSCRHSQSEAVFLFFFITLLNSSLCEELLVLKENSDKSKPSSDLCMDPFSSQCTRQTLPTVLLHLIIAHF